MPRLNFKGEKEGMADSWSQLVIAQISPSQSVSGYQLLFENVYQQADQSRISHYILQQIYTKKILHIHPEGALRREERYSTIADEDNSPNAP